MDNRKRKFNQTQALYVPKNSSSTLNTQFPQNYSRPIPNYWNLRNGQMNNRNFTNSNSLTQEETENLKRKFKLEKEEEEITQELKRKIEVERRWSEMTQEDKPEIEKIKILEKELKRANRKIEKLEEEIEDLLEENNQLKGKNQKLKKGKNIKNIIINSDEEINKEDNENTDEEVINKKKIKEEINKLISTDVTEAKIKALGKEKLIELCNTLKISYDGVAKTSKKLFINF